MMQMVTQSNQMDVLEDMITPLARTPYDAQLVFKAAIVRQFLKTLRSHGVAKSHVDILPMEPSVSFPVETSHFRSLEYRFSCMHSTREL